MTKLSEKMKLLAAAKKLSSNSPPEAHFHRAMRKYHKEQYLDHAHDAREIKRDSKYVRKENTPKDNAKNDKDYAESIRMANLHKDYAAHHDAEYKKANR